MTELPSLVRILLLTPMAWLLMACSFLNPPPKDAALIQVFNANRETFETLVSMICEDGYAAISMDPAWTRPANVPETKKQSYYGEFRKIGVSQVQASRNSSDGQCQIQLSVWAVGLGGDGEYKDYRFRPTITKEDFVVDDLDKVKAGNEIRFYYREIAADWYISYRIWP